MPCLQSVQSPVNVAVGMGQAVFAAEPSRLTTIVGSCVAVTLYSPRRRLGMLGHIVLPKSRGGGDNPAKYADTAIPHMLSTLRREGVVPSELTAKLAGGACMFGDGQFSRIGENNVQAAVQALESAGIGIVAPRRRRQQRPPRLFRSRHRHVTVASVGRPARTI